MSGKKTPPMIQICLFKEKEKEGNEERSQFDGQWKVLMLVALGMYQCLVANGRRKKRKSTFFHFPPINFT